MDQFSTGLAKISIVTPSKNQGQFIEATIRSILEQSCPNLEYIIIDGNSQDSSADIIKKYSSKLTYWCSELDDGQAHAINKGLKRAKGTYATWINSDDLLAEGGVDNILASIEEHPDIDLFIGQFLAMNENGDLENLSKFHQHNDSLPFRLASFPYVQPACFFKLETVRKLGYLDEQFEITMDKDLFLRIVLSGGKVLRISKPIGIFREQPGAKTVTYSPQWKYERNLVFSQFLRSIQTEKNILDKFIKTGLYVAGEGKYPVNISISKADTQEAIRIFLSESISMHFYHQQFRDAYLLAKRIEKIFPGFISSKEKIWKYKSFLCMYPFVRYFYMRGALAYRFLKNKWDTPPHDW